MSARINLLPHRAETRKRGRNYFYFLCGLVFAFGAVIVLGVHTFYAEKISAQEGRNRFLKGQIAILDKEIAEINKLKDEIQALLARKAIIETLQADRAQTVHLLDELVKQTPEGVYLKSLVQKGMRVQVGGYAQSNARVSTLMRNIEASPWLEQPVLVEVKAASVDKRRVSQFDMFLFLKRAAAPDKDKPAAKPPAKKG